MTKKPYNPWAMCDNCKDVHRESDRIMKKCRLCKGVSWSHCPKCNATAMAPLAMVPKQRNLFESTACAAVS